MNRSVALITGGAGNVGHAVTRSFLEAGAKVAVPVYKTDRPDALDAAREEFGDRLNVFALDLTTERGAEAAVRNVVEWAGRVDVVVHMIGGYAGGSLVAETPVEVWDRMIDLNLKSAFLVAQATLPSMLENGGGRMVFVSSRAAHTERRGAAAYAVSKSALITLTEAIAEEYGDRGLRANIVLPGTVDTPDNRAAMPKSAREKWVTPEQIARTILFLSSPQADGINGASVPIFG